MSADAYTLQQQPWSQCGSVCSAIRRQVFIAEQGVPEDEEWDGLDGGALHFVLRHHTHAVACARLLYLHGAGPRSCKVTRMAVLRAQRGIGLGSKLLQAMITHATGLGCQRLELDAQCQAQGFYSRFGFSNDGKPFMDAGIEHVKMVKTLV